MLLHAMFVAALGGDDVYISLPDRGEVRRFNATTGVIEPFASGLVTPYYGEVNSSGELFVQDASLAAIWKIAPDGTKKPFSAGGLIGMPLSVTIHPTTGDLYVSDALYQHVVKIDGVSGAQSVFSDNSQGLYSIPGGLAFDRDGNLWMTDHGNYFIFKIDPSGVATPVFDGAAAGLAIPAGIELDTAGNVFVAAYGSDVVVRIRIDSGEWEVFCDDPLLAEPNDLTMSPDGSGLLCSCAESNAIVRIDSLGNAAIVCQDAALGEFLGAAVPGVYPGCTGGSTPFGTGTPGTGGFTPRLAGIFSPTLGSTLSYDIDRLNGGATGLFVWSLGQSNLSIWGGTLYVDFTTVWGLLPFTAAGAGAGNGRALLQFSHPDDAALENLDFYVQAIAFDAAASHRKALSNGLQVTFGAY